MIISWFIINCKSFFANVDYSNKASVLKRWRPAGWVLRGWQVSGGSVDGRVFFCCPLRRPARLAPFRSYQRLAPPAISTFISRIGARWTRRSTAATAVISSGKILPQFSNGWLAVMRSERRSYRTEMSSKSTLVSAWSLRTVVKSSRITR